MYSFVSILNIIFSVLMIVNIVVTVKYLKKKRPVKKVFIEILFFFFLFKIIFYYLMPPFFDLFFDHRFLREYNVPPISSLQLYLVEYISTLIWAFSIIIFTAFSKSLSQNDFESHNFLENRKPFNILFALTVIYFIITIFNLINFMGTVSMPFWLEIFKSLSNYLGPPASVVLMIYGFYTKKYGFGIFGTLGYLLSLTVADSRGSIVYSFLFILFVLYHLKGFRYAKKIALRGGMILGLVWFITAGFPNITLDPVSGDVGFVIDDSKSRLKGPIYDFDFRFGALSRMSTKFIDLYDRGQGAGLNPIKHSLMAVLPRSINPDKPIPSTLDPSDIYSQGMYIIYRETFGYDTYSMVEFSTGAHAYWEGGFIGVIALTFISALYIFLVMKYSKRLGLAGIVLLIGTFKPWGYMDPKIWVSDIVMQLYQLIIPFILLTTIVNFFSKRKSRLNA